MKYNTQLATLNAGKGALLILRILHEQAPLDTKTLREEFENYGEGATAFLTSRDVCFKLCLIATSEERFHSRGTISLMHTLTEKGKKVAEKVKEIDDLLM
jgi:DNA-binding PadR family transcriptional regulator